MRESSEKNDERRKKNKVKEYSGKEKKIVEEKALDFDKKRSYSALRGSF